MTDKKSIWNVINKWRRFRLFLFLRWSTGNRYEMLIMKEIDSDFFLLIIQFLFFKSFFLQPCDFLCLHMTISYNLFFFFLVSVFSMRFLFFVFRSAQNFSIYICHTLFVFDEKKTISQFFDDVETNGLIPLDKTKINNEKVSKNLESNTKTNYDCMLHFWHEWVFVRGFVDLIKSWKHSLKIYFGK